MKRLKAIGQKLLFFVVIPYLFVGALNSGYMWFTVSRQDCLEVQEGMLWAYCKFGQGPGDAIALFFWPAFWF